MNRPAPVPLMTISLSARAQARREKGTAWPPISPARAVARWAVRLVTSIRAAPQSARLRAASSPVEPALITSTVLSSRAPTVCLARATAAELTETQ